jgi:hypothetical protein
VLEGAIAEGVSTSDPLFGYADRYDEAAGRYDGLAFGKLAPTAFAATAVIVRKEIAAEASRPSGDNGAVITRPMGPSGPGDPSRGGGEIPIPPADRKPRRFFGTVEIDTVRPIKSFETIVNAVVAELQRAPGAKVTLTLDIQATHDEGFEENDVGVIRDNTRQLKFRADSTGFEE